VNSTRALRERFPRPSKAPSRGESARSIVVLYSVRLLRPRASPREMDHSPCASIPAEITHRMAHEPTDPAIAVWERVDVVEAVMGGIVSR
jgi:hypothetical protein